MHSIRRFWLTEWGNSYLSTKQVTFDEDRAALHINTELMLRLQQGLVRTFGTPGSYSCRLHCLPLSTAHFRIACAGSCSV